MPPQNRIRESTVLVLVKNKQKVLESGTGIVLCHDDVAGKSYILSCQHTLRAMGRRLQPSEEKILVNGLEADAVSDSKLESYDLVILKTPRINKSPATMKISADLPTTVFCEGYVPFIQSEYAHQSLAGEVKGLVPTLSPDGLAVSHLKIRTKKRGSAFKKGLSGGPVYDANGRVVGVSRVLEKAEKGENFGYAIQLSPELMGILSQIVKPSIISIEGRTEPDSGRPRPQPEPDLKSEAENDIQKNRWGGKSFGWGYEITVENVKQRRSSFTFDAVLKRTSPGNIGEGPFIFHLHNTYPKSVIWIRKSRGTKAVLEEIYAEGTYTLGVQFHDDQGEWRSLEYDLSEYDGGVLMKYD